MTSIAIAMMIEGGHLQLDTPIHESLADLECDAFYKKVFAAMPQTTPRQLLSHTSGLHDGLGAIYEEDLGPQMIGFSSVRDYIEHFSSFDTEFALEEPKSYQYCNFGIDLLGLAIEAITGDYYQYVHDNVLKIAGMEETVPLRQPGPTFAVPYLTPTSIPVVPILQNPEREKVLIKDVLTYAQTFSRYAKQIDLLIAEYHLGLLERTPDEFSAFKMEMMRKIEPIFNALKHPAHLDIIKRIEAVGIFLHDDVMEMQKNDSKNPNLSDLRKLDEFLHDSYDYFSAKPLMGVLNSLSMASPSGRNMYSTVDDMLKFEEAINTGTLSSYNSHLTTNTAPFENNHSMRYGLGCFISGNHDDPEYTIAHGGYAPGMHSAFRSLPNLGYAVVALANNDESQQIMADRVQSHLIFGSKQTVFYFDLRIDPAVTQLLQSAIDERSLVSNLSHEAAFTEHTTEYRRNIDAMRGSDPDHIASNVSSDQEDGQEPEGSSVNPS